MKKKKILLTVVLWLQTACQTGEFLDSSSSFNETSDFIIGGEFTCNLPSIGKLNTTNRSCTATLLSSQVILSASHCFGHQSGIVDINDPNYYFLINLGCGETIKFPIERYKSFGNGSEENQTGDCPIDISLALLRNRVPEEVATPLPLSSRMPYQGEEIQAFGYGCYAKDETGNRVYAEQKSTIGFLWGDSMTFGCRGDSGGPFLTSANEIFGTFCGYYGDDPEIKTGDTVANYTTIHNQVKQWTEHFPPCIELGESCTLHSDRCALYSCRRECHPIGTPKESICDLKLCPGYPTVGECDQHKDRCAWYYGAPLGCLPRGTDPKLVEQCGAIASPGKCTGECAWYGCVETCLPFRTDLDMICGGCDEIFDPDDCYGDCGWYSCQSRCVPRGLENERVCNW